LRQMRLANEHDEHEHELFKSAVRAAPIRASLPRP